MRKLRTHACTHTTATAAVTKDKRKEEKKGREKRRKKSAQQHYFAQSQLPSASVVRGSDMGNLTCDVLAGIVAWGV